MINAAFQLPRELRISINYLANQVQRDPEKKELVVSFIRALAKHDEVTAESIIRNEWHKPGHGMEDLMKPFRDTVKKEQVEFARTLDPVYNHKEPLLACAEALS